MKKPKTPYQRIVRAAKKGGIGVLLNPDECLQLSLDDAISTRATLDDENDKGVSDAEIYSGETGVRKRASKGAKSS